MNLSSLTFLVAGLPVLLLCYYFMPNKGKQAALLTASFIFYGWGSPLRVLYLAACILFDYGIGLLLEHWREKKTLSCAVLAAAAVVHTAAMVWVRNAEATALLYPFGFAIYTLQGLGYLIAVYRGRHPAAVNLLYLSFFPILYMGPMTTYLEFSEQIRRNHSSIVHLSEGLALYIRGLAEKVVLADTFGYVFRELRQTNGMSMLTAWLTTITFSLYLYFEMLGVSEMARGLGKCFGLELPRNFSQPFFRSTVTGFMQSWNITLVLWFQTNFRYFLFGSRHKKWQKYAILILMWILIGAWYGLTLQFLLWGLAVGVLLTLDQLVLEKVFRKNFVAGMLYTGIVMQFVWVLFFGDSLSETGSIWAAMLGFGNGLIDKHGVYFFTSYIALLLIGMYIATDLFRNITERLHSTKWGKILHVFQPVLYGLLMLFCVASMLYGDRVQGFWLRL